MMNVSRKAGLDPPSHQSGRPSRTRRRQFLQSLIGVGGAAALGGTLRFLGDRPPSGEAFTGARETPPADLCRTRRQGSALGTLVSVTVIHEDPRHAEMVIDEVFIELERVEQIMSIYRPESELSRLNRERRLVRPHPYLVEVLRASQEMSDRSDGAFDITVQPLWELWIRSRRTGERPATREIDDARRRVDWRLVDVKTDRVRLGGEAAVTLNGVAQGFAADRLVALFRKHGVEHALVDSGETATVGTKPDDTDWRVGVRHPRRRFDHLAVAQLSGLALATSGDYATTFAEGYQYHHLFDPRTGSSAGEMASTSVVARSAMTADALSTAAFVLGERRGRQLVSEFADCEALFVRKDGETTMTSGFPAV